MSFTVMLLGSSYDFCKQESGLRGRERERIIIPVLLPNQNPCSQNRTLLYFTYYFRYRVMVNSATRTYLLTSTVLRRGLIVSDKAHRVGYMQEQDSGAGVEPKNRIRQSATSRLGPPFGSCVKPTCAIRNKS